MELSKEYKAKSIIIGRKKDKVHPDKDMPYNVEVKFFAINNPHMTDEVPIESLEFENIHRVIMKGFQVNFLPRGADIVINDIQNVRLEHDSHGHIILTNLN